MQLQKKEINKKCMIRKYIHRLEQYFLCQVHQLKSTCCSFLTSSLQRKHSYRNTVANSALHVFFYFYVILIISVWTPKLPFRWLWHSTAQAYINHAAHVTYVVSWREHLGAGMLGSWLDVYLLKASQRWEPTSSSWQQKKQTQEQQSHHLQMLQKERKPS